MPVARMTFLLKYCLRSESVVVKKVLLSSGIMDETVPFIIDTDV